MKKVRIKINRYIKNVGEDDLIVDNGAYIQVPTQHGKRNGYFYDPLLMSKNLFSQLKNFGLIFIDKERTERANKQFGDTFLTYYRFDIGKMIQFGYPTVED